MITVEDREAIRKAYYLEHKSIRQIAREQHHSRRTIRKAMALRVAISIAVVFAVA